MAISKYKKLILFRAMYVMAFMFAVSFAVPLYINSSFLGEFTSDKVIGFIYTIGSILTLIALAFMPKILTRVGNFKAMLGVTTLLILSLLGLAFTHSVYFIIPIFIVYSFLVSILFLNFDVFLETFTKDASTGRVRGNFLTFVNIGVLIAPLIAGFIMATNEYWKVFSLAAILLTVLAIVLFMYFRDFKDPIYDHISVWKTIKFVWSNPDIQKVFFANLFLKMFFALMVIYSPIYLHEHIGFDWSTIGVIFFIMLLPYVLFEKPLGKLADTKWGEKEIMTIGFLIMAFSSIAMVFISLPVFWIWAVVLFITRVGASFVEITTESYFFKHVDGGDTNVISFFRDTRPIAYIVGPMLGSLVLVFADFKYIFLVIGLLMLWGIRYSWTIHDTK